MTDEAFAALVQRLDTHAERDPRGYRSRVVLLALLGYGYLALVLALLLAVFVVLLLSIVYLKALALKLAIPLGVFLWMLIRALRVKIPPPEGRVLSRDEVPALFGAVDDLCGRLGAPRFHRILLVDDFNAAVAQTPRLGPFGWYRNHLLVGLPLMKALTVEQFKAVLAHEIGHLAGGHGRMAHWIYRLRMSWARLLATLETSGGSGSVLFTRFFRWYTPYFNAYSFPLARADEYEADRAAARLTSAAASAQALTGVNVIGAYLAESFWPGIRKQADDSPRPQMAPLAGLGEKLAVELDPDRTSRWLERALERETSLADTHPSLRDRLRALGAEPALAIPKADETADRLLGAALPGLTHEFDRRWQENIREAWDARYRETQAGRQRLAELDARMAGGESLPFGEAMERARLTEDVGAGPDAALEQFRSLQAGEPDNAAANFALGCRLLARDDPAGAPLVERTIAENAAATIIGCEALRDYHWRAGRQEDAHAWHRRMVARQTLEAAAAVERQTLRTTDKFDAHDLPADVVADLRREVVAVPGIRRAYFVRKRVQHFTDERCYVLGFCITPWWGFHSKQRAAEVQRRILDSVTFPGETFVLCVQGGNRRFGRKLRFMRGARLL